MAFTADDVAKMAERYAAAWSSRAPEAVASFYAEDGQIAINRGDTIKGRSSVAEMAAGFYAEFPDLIVHMDEVRVSGTHALFVWTLEGNHSETGNYVKVGGWEEWELNDDLQVASSFGWFNAEDYDRQIAEGI